MTKKALLEPANIVVFILLIIALGYTGYRAYVLSMTHDESFAYLIFVRSPISNILALDPPNAGNHLLNTLLMKLFSHFLGTHQFVLRLPALLAQVGYLIFSYLILKRLGNKVLLISGFILLNFSPYFLDFSSLARGYSLAHMFILGSVYYLFMYYECKKPKYSTLSLIFACLAAYSQFIMLYFYAGLIIFFNLLFISEVYSEKTLSQKFKLLIKKNIPTFFILLASVIIFFEPIRRLIKFNQLYGRGTTSFWHDTIKTVSHGSLYNKMYFASEVNFFACFIVIIFIITALVLIVDYLIKRKVTNFRLLLIFGLVMCVVFVSQLHCILGNGQYLLYRSALFYYPLIIISLIMLFYHFKSYLKGIPIAIVALAMAGVMLYHFANSANAKYVMEWIYDCNTQQMVKDVYEDYQKKPSKEKISIAIHWTFEPTINYYRVTKKYDWLEQANRDGFESQADYYYIYPEDSAYLYKTGKEILKRYEFSNTILAKTPNNYSSPKDSLPQ